MSDFDRTTAQLIEANAALQRQIAQLEADLMRSKTFGDMIITSAGEGIAVLDRDLRYVIWNPFMEKLLGITAQNIIGQYIFDMFPQLLNEKVDQVLSDVLGGISRRSIDTRYYIQQTGKSGWASVLYTPHYAADGEIIGVIALVDDITERKMAENALKERESGFRALFEGAPDAIVLIDIETGKIVDVNPAAMELFQRAYDELLSMYHWQLHPSYAEETVKANFDKRVVDSSFKEPMEHIILRGDNTKLVAELRGQKTRLNGRDVMQGIFRDLSARVESENQKFQLALEHERMQLIASFITDVSHEFRTPLSTIKTRTYLLRRLLKTDEYNNHINVIDSQVDDLAALVNNLVTMSKLDMQGTFNFEKLSLGHILRQVIDNRQEILVDKQLHVNMEVFDAPVQANNDHLMLAVMHILDNAIKYTPIDGTITIKMQLINDEAVIVDIADTGKGIKEVHLPHIWKRFYQGEEQPDMRGFGLGLPIAQAIIQRHNGDIDIQSTPGKGTSVQIMLPLSV